MLAAVGRRSIGAVDVVARVTRSRWPALHNGAPARRVTWSGERRGAEPKNRSDTEPRAHGTQCAWVWWHAACVGSAARSVQGRDGRSACNTVASYHVS